MLFLFFDSTGDTEYTDDTQARTHDRWRPGRQKGEGGRRERWNETGGPSDGRRRRVRERMRGGKTGVLGQVKGYG